MGDSKELEELLRRGMKAVMTLPPKRRKHKNAQAGEAGDEPIHEEKGPKTNVVPFRSRRRG